MHASIASNKLNLVLNPYTATTCFDFLVVTLMYHVASWLSVIAIATIKYVYIPKCKQLRGQFASYMEFCTL